MVYQASLFNNENMLLQICAEEGKDNIDRIVITEANRTFQNKNKCQQYLDKGYDNVEHHFEDVSRDFIEPDVWGSIKLLRYKFKRDGYSNILSLPAWYNDAFQRNRASSQIHPQEDDIVILSDIDEIIDRREFDLLVNEARERGIVTGKLHFTIYYFNLFSQNWGGAPDYSYRLFAMTGRYFNNMNMTSDELRKRGERGELTDKIYCLDRFIGFHHSWLGDEEFIYNKMHSYAHISEHKGMNSREYIHDCLERHVSFLPGHTLVEDDSIRLLETVEDLREIEPYKQYFL